MPHNPLREALNPLMDKLDKLAYEQAEKNLDELIDALAEDLGNPNAPAERATAAVDLGSHIFLKVKPEIASMMLSIACFRAVDAKATVPEGDSL
jgi:chorismate synthase